MGNVAFPSDMKEVFRSNCTDLVSIPCHCTVRNVDNRIWIDGWMDGYVNTS